jgi:transposase
LARVKRKAAASFFHWLRQIIARQLEDSLPVNGLVEVDESYFGGVRKGKRGRVAAGPSSASSSAAAKSTP